MIRLAVQTQLNLNIFWKHIAKSDNLRPRMCLRQGMVDKSNIVPRQHVCSLLFVVFIANACFKCFFWTSWDMYVVTALTSWGLCNTLVFDSASSTFESFLKQKLPNQTISHPICVTQMCPRRGIVDKSHIVARQHYFPVCCLFVLLRFLCLKCLSWTT